MSRKPDLTIVPVADQLPDQIHLQGLCCYFAEFTPGYRRPFLQYTFPDDALAIMHVTEYGGSIDWFGEKCCEVRCRYYEVEYPDAPLELTLIVKVEEDQFTTRVWQQRYPGGTAESVAMSDVEPRWLRPGERKEAAGMTVQTEAQAYRLDSCGEVSFICARTLRYGAAHLREQFIDIDGKVRLTRYYTAGDAPDRPMLTVDGHTYSAVYDEVPSELVFAVWSGAPKG